MKKILILQCYSNWCHSIITQYEYENECMVHEEDFYRKLCKKQNFYIYFGLLIETGVRNKN
jgi:hypothetical protein